MPKISVIIPCYRTHEDLLCRCIRSILMQTFDDYEIIIVDDGNSEAYRKVYQQSIFSDNRIKILYRDNAGVSASRNYGIENAMGDYVVFSDADDIMLKNFLKEAYEIAIQYKCDCVIGGEYNLEKLDDVEATLSGKYPIDVFEGKKIESLRKHTVGKNIYRFESGLSGIGQGPWTRLIKRDLAKSIQFDTKLPIGEDVVWNFELLKNVKKICVAQTIWYGYYYNPDSATRRFRENAIIESRDSLLRIKEYLNLDDDQEFYAYSSRCFVDLYRIFICYLRKCNLSKRELHKVCKKIYTEYPWKVVASNRYFSLCHGKDRITSILFRMHLLFTYYTLKNVKYEGILK